MKGRAMLRAVRRQAKYLAVVVLAELTLKVTGVKLPGVSPLGWLGTVQLRWADAIIAALGVWAAWNSWYAAEALPAWLGERKQARELARARKLLWRCPPPLPRPLTWAEDHWAQGAARSSYRTGLRYMGPPAISTGPLPVFDLGTYRHDWRALGTSLGTCGKCGYPLPRHTYYGTGTCVIAADSSPGVTVLPCKGCGAFAQVPDMPLTVLCWDCTSKQG